MPPKTEHAFWALPWQRGEHPGRGSTLGELLSPGARPSLLPVQCCHVLPPRLKPPPLAQGRRMTHSSSGADMGGLA